MSDRNPLALRSLQPSRSGNHIAGKNNITNMKDQSDAKLKPANKSYSKLVHFFQKKTKPSSNLDENSTYSEGSQTDQSLSPVNDVCDVGEQTEVSIPVTAPEDSANDIRDFMLSTTPTARYWQVLAEERGKHLQEQAEDNLQMTIEISNLKEENRQLRHMAEEGQHFANILKEMLGEEGNTEITHSQTVESGFFDETPNDRSVICENDASKSEVAT